ncbi:unnamed protein product [Phytophthora fragariaefolia]|uniref:Unnamed protein product n=1 Tax=Phytophthora fragariaefolia TaxID=1490495 RepID=A0A9W7D7G0_9STRA|nr:unnamed protein product [Phytophthora fragariaefolia]
MVRLTSDGHGLVAQMSQIAAEACVVALLFEHITFYTNEWSSNDIHALEASILTSTLGLGSSSGSRDASHTLGGYLETASMPNPTKQCQWVDPKSGETHHFPLQHAVDFAYYVDGKHSPVPSSVGESFCRPAIATSHSAAAEISSGASAQDVQDFFDPFLDDDDSPQDVSDCVGNASCAATGSKNSAKRLRGEDEGTDVDQRKLSRRRIALDRGALIRIFPPHVCQDQSGIRWGEDDLDHVKGLGLRGPDIMVTPRSNHLGMMITTAILGMIATLIPTCDRGADPNDDRNINSENDHDTDSKDDHNDNPDCDYDTDPSSDRDADP